MHRLTHLLGSAGLPPPLFGAEADVRDVQFDSRKVGSNSCFVAVPGTHVDGHDYIDRAIELGASAIVCERLPSMRQTTTAYVVVRSASMALALLAHALQKAPSTRLDLVGVTGTNGKTSTATIMHRLLGAMGKRAGLLSTIHNLVGDEIVASTHTTGDAVQIAGLMARMVESGCTHCLMEVTSHAIHQNRIGGLHFTGAVFTNLTQDHLDYHLTLDAYAGVKKNFFDNLLTDAFALTNADDPRGRWMVQDTPARRFTYGRSPGNDFNFDIVERTAVGMRLRINGHETTTALVGDFNAYNLCAAISALTLLGLEFHDLCGHVPLLTPVEGRMQRIEGANGVVAVIDFAHTPDALEKALATLRQASPGATIVTVVGCGGDRDQSKRPTMARIAASNSDCVIFTSDNPRNEDPAEIAAQMLSGLDDRQRQRVEVVLDRREAIQSACRNAKSHTVVLVAGKGHEKYQEVGGVRTPFDDADIVRLALS